MTSQSPARAGLSARTSRIIGREEELWLLKECLLARGERHYLYFWAGGGLGKTRVLEELQHMVEEAGPGYYSSGILDLYHTDTHSSSDVERAIVEGLDPMGKYFCRYRQERARYELLRERGTDPSVLERLREALSTAFVEDCRQMALEARKLVICFDTVELLQYESSVVEQMAGLDMVDTRIRSWMLDKLARLANVLVVLVGRPKPHSPGETVDHQARLVNDMQRAFGDDLTVRELKALTLDEARDFIRMVTGDVQVIPDQDLSIVHHLTGGRPIFMHLIVDLIQVLAREPRQILDLFREHAGLLDSPQDDERLKVARQQVEVAILRGIFSERSEIGGYLGRLALMPKGVNDEILHRVLGMPLAEAQKLLTRLESLSFIKRYRAPAGAQRLHGERLFLHDEVYHLLTGEVMPHLRLNEREVANGLINNYYDRLIAEMGRQLSSQPTEERVKMRERLHKLEVERLYYSLVRNPAEGYAEYKRLSDEACRQRWVGQGMRLLDEFLRFYNDTERRNQFEAVGIDHEQVIRESGQLWVERFHWWGQYSKEVEFARRILDQPEAFAIRPQEDSAILGNVAALWARARAMLYGFEETVTEEILGVLRGLHSSEPAPTGLVLALLEKLPPLAECTPEQLLARARLCTSIGYEYRWSGDLVWATHYYGQASAALRKLGTHPDELAIVLNNLAFVYARQGRITEARILGDEALGINEEKGNDYSRGLTLSNLAHVERMAGNFAQAIKDAEEALGIFRTLEDPHGTVRSLLSIGYSKRRLAKDELVTSHTLPAIPRELEEAQAALAGAMEVALGGGLESEIPGLKAELGRVFRELGRGHTRLEGLAKGIESYRKAESLLREALEWPGWGIADQAEIVQDLAECLLLSGDARGAEEAMAEAEARIGAAHRIIPGQQVPEGTLPTQYFMPLGKVERQRGDIAFERGQYKNGIYHYFLAYLYFQRFSPVSVERDDTIGRLYAHMRRLGVEAQAELVGQVHAWTSELKDPRAQVGSFHKILKDLLGV